MTATVPDAPAVALDGYGSRLDAFTRVEQKLTALYRERKISAGELAVHLMSCETASTEVLVRLSRQLDGQYQAPGTRKMRRRWHPAS